MRRVFIVSLLLAVAAGGARAAELGWRPAAGPLMTRWAKNVTAEKAHPEYPRPQMVRKEWLNLNGLWQLAFAKEGEAVPAGQELPERILVPFPVESALSGVMKKADRLWYRRTFTLPKAWAGKHVELHFGAVDWEATVTVNGKTLGTHRGGYDPFSYDITDALKPTGPQEIVVGVFDPTDKGQQPHGKQVNNPGGIMYTSTTGIWQTVWLEPVPATRIQSLKMVPDIDAKCLRLTVGTAGPAEDVTVTAVALDGGRKVGQAEGKPGAEIEVPVPNAKLWEPDAPFLYTLKVTLTRAKKPVDAVDSYFGMRKIAIAKDDKGINRILLNGRFVFQVGPLDQGFWPDGIYTAPTDEALRYDIEELKRLGMNVARKHVKVEPDRWYYWCDKLGLLVWQDMPAGSNGTPEAKTQFEAELKQLIETHWSHPSIIMWVVFNEGWGQYDTERLVKWVKEEDPSRLVDNASGWTDKKCGDVIDMHNYPGPGSPKPEPERAAVLGEFGGLGLGVDGHTWTQKTWGYRQEASTERLTQSYCKLLRRAYQLKDDPGLCACIYTQTTDCETECNGLMTYDRAVLKVDEKQAAAANRGEFPPPPTYKDVVPTAEKEAATWRYTTDKPADDWFKPDFDAGQWKEGKSGFGTKNTPGAIVGTEWKGADIWIRREFTLGDGKLNDPQLRLHHDEDVEVYINGALALKAGGFTTEYDVYPMERAALAALKPGKNVLAVHCHQTMGGQFVDVGIVEVEKK